MRFKAWKNLILFCLVGMVLLSLAPSAGTAQPTSRSRVAVLDFANLAGLQEHEVIYISDLMRSVGVRSLPSDRFIMMTRENIFELLPEGQNLADCLGECAVETGRKIGADYVVTGEVLRFGGEFRLNVKLHETTTGGQLSDVQIGGLDILELEACLSEESKGLFDPIAGADTTGLIPVTPSLPPTTPTPDKSVFLTTVTFNSSPAGATVVIDGEPTNKTTPCTLELPTGTTEVGLQLAGYYLRQETVVFQRGIPNWVVWDLRPEAPPTVSYPSTPSTQVPTTQNYGYGYGQRPRSSNLYKGGLLLGFHIGRLDNINILETVNADGMSFFGLQGEIRTSARFTLRGYFSYGNNSDVSLDSGTDTYYGDLRFLEIGGAFGFRLNEYLEVSFGLSKANINGDVSSEYYDFSTYDWFTNSFSEDDSYTTVNFGAFLTPSILKLGIEVGAFTHEDYDVDTTCVRFLFMINLVS